MKLEKLIKALFFPPPFPIGISLIISIRDKSVLEVIPPAALIALEMVVTLSLVLLISKLVFTSLFKADLLKLPSPIELLGANKPFWSTEEFWESLISIFSSSDNSPLELSLILFWTFLKLPTVYAGKV